MKYRLFVVVLGISLLLSQPVFASSDIGADIASFWTRCVEWVKTTFNLSDSSDSSDSSISTESDSIISSNSSSSSDSSAGSTNVKSEESARRGAFLEKYDTDDDGTLSKAEIAVAEADREQEMLTRYDADGDGALSDTEKDAMRKDAPKGGHRAPPPERLASGSMRFRERQQEFVKKYDTDGDGKLNKTEMDAAKAARDQERLAKYDADGDGTLSDTEKEAMMQDMRKRGHTIFPRDGIASGRPDFQAKHEEFVKKFDTDGDGTLSETELDVADAAREQEMLTQYDADGDGTLSETEKEAMDKDAPKHGHHGEIASDTGESVFIPDAELIASGSGDVSSSLDKGISLDRKHWRRGTRVRPGVDQIEARRQAMIKMYDADGDGILSNEEKANARSTFQGYYEEIADEQE